MVSRFLYAGAVILAGAVVSIYLLLNQTDNLVTEPEYDYVQCPTKDNFEQLWNIWSYEYINQNPDADVDTQMADWNSKIMTNGCGEEWLNPLADLIEQHGASGTPVYWYDNPH